ncbi:APH(3'') family aminoglycoside O-phosphotransferase [Chitinophaga pendula]|uniref:APH(3'') family aminoglycoside O-phosphotransferase n=1 Tax=Chitinophaga pendula TaxID=2849666 RepID=UPI001CEC8B7C|nr:APH(3'') family aminoglycoside O-phosphotransferase [Chitinophaga pendula]UCJ06660.1 APH(3'') family aminoglycoside O-phosphotransferase [Chitinophaga pendula]
MNNHLLPLLPAGIHWVPVQHGESGDLVYQRSDEEAYAKISTGPRALSLAAEKDRLLWLADKDLPTPKVLDWIETATGSCLLISPIPGIPASKLTAEQLSIAWTSITRQLQALHQLPVNNCPFDRRLSLMFAQARDVVARGAVNPDFLRPEQHHIPAATLLANLEMSLQERLAQESAEQVVCHGDACLPNFMVDPVTLQCTGMIDLGRLGKADPYVDYTLLLANSEETWPQADQQQAAYIRLFQLLQIDHPDTSRLDFYLQLDPLTWG